MSPLFKEMTINHTDTDALLLLPGLLNNILPNTLNIGDAFCLTYKGRKIAIVCGHHPASIKYRGPETKQAAVDFLQEAMRLTYISAAALVEYNSNTRSAPGDTSIVRF